MLVPGTTVTGAARKGEKVEVTVEGGINFLNLTAFVNEPAWWGLEFVARF